MTVVTTHDATLRFEMDGMDPGDMPRGGRIEWERSGAVPATVTGDCEPATVAGQRRQVAAGEWDTSQPIPPVAYDGLLRRMAPEGVPRRGRYGLRWPKARQGRWTLAIDSAPPAVEVRIAIEGPDCACLEVPLLGPGQETSAAARVVESSQGAIAFGTRHLKLKHR